MNLSTVKRAQWDKTQSKLFKKFCATTLCYTVLHTWAVLLIFPLTAHQHLWSYSFVLVIVADCTIKQLKQTVICVQLQKVTISRRPIRQMWIWQLAADWLQQSCRRGLERTATLALAKWDWPADRDLPYTHEIESKTWIDEGAVRTNYIKTAVKLLWPGDRRYRMQRLGSVEPVKLADHAVLNATLVIVKINCSVMVQRHDFV